MAKAKKRRVRLSLDVTQEVKASLELLREQMSLSSFTEVIRKALALLHCVSDLQREGKKLVIRNADGSEETLQIL